MLKKIIVSAVVLASLSLIGCASVPMAPAETDKSTKSFNAPSEGMAGLYVYRNSSFGAALKKSIMVDGEIIGISAANTFFYKEIKPGMHEISTESEFSPNKILVEFKSGMNHFVQQYIKMGAFVGGANVREVSEEEGKKGVLECKLAQELPRSTASAQ